MSSSHHTVLPQLLLLLVLSYSEANIDTTDGGQTERSPALITGVVVPLANISLDKLVGRWYVVEEVGLEPTMRHMTCWHANFWRHENGTLMVQTLIRKHERTMPRGPPSSVSDNGVWHYPAEDADVDVAVVDLSPEGRFLSWAWCLRRTRVCTGFVLARNISDARRHEELTSVHQRLSDAQINYTDVGWPANLNRCRRKSKLRTLPEHHMALVRYNVTTTTERYWQPEVPFEPLCTESQEDLRCEVDVAAALFGAAAEGIHVPGHHPFGGAPDMDPAWISQLVQPFANLSLDKLIGRWYMVELIGPVALLDATCEWFDFCRDGNGTVMVQWFERAGGRNNVELPRIPVLGQGVWHCPAGYAGFAVIDLSPDDRFLSVATCLSISTACMGLVLARDTSDALRRGDLAQVHRRLAAARLNFTDVGWPKDPEACRLDGILKNHPSRTMQPIHYNLTDGT